MRNFYYFVGKFLYFLFFGLCTLYITGLIFQASSALAVGFNLSNLPAAGFIILSFVVLAILWRSFFVKTAPLEKIFVIALLAGYFWLPQKFPSLQQNLAFNDCLEIGTCVEGIEINTGKGQILINKENCQSHNWQWDEETRECNIRRKVQY